MCANRAGWTKTVQQLGFLNLEINFQLVFNLGMHLTQHNIQFQTVTNRIKSVDILYNCWQPCPERRRRDRKISPSARSEKEKRAEARIRRIKKRKSPKEREN
jgi:hypothetical protein